MIKCITKKVDVASIMVHSWALFEKYVIHIYPYLATKMLLKFYLWPKNSIMSVVRVARLLLAKAAVAAFLRRIEPATQPRIKGFKLVSSCRTIQQLFVGKGETWA
jgi:hypothetical protein